MVGWGGFVVDSVGGGVVAMVVGVWLLSVGCRWVAVVVVRVL